MSSNPFSPVRQQVARAGRRLFVQTLLDRLAWCWAAALAVAAVWFLVQPLLTGEVDEALRWWVAGGLAVAATAAAAALAWRQSPGPLAVALAVDERLGLKERVTTTLTLTPAQAKSPAGQALLADVSERLAPLNVRSRFPVRLRWTAALVPASAVALALVALFYDPSLLGARADAAAKKEDDAAAQQAAQKFKELQKRPAKTLLKDQAKSEELKEIQAAWDKLLEQPLDPNDKEKIRERVQAVRDLEEKLKDRAADLKAQMDKAERLKDQLRKLAELDAKDPNLKKEGAAKDIRDALAKGQLDKAQEQLEGLRKKLEENKLDEKQRKELQEQMQGLRDQLKQLAEQKDRKDLLQRLREQGDLNPEQLQQAMDQLQQEGADMQELADLLDECQECLGKGNNKGAAKKLKMVKGKLEKLELTEEELKELENNEEALAELREVLAARLNGMGGGGPPGTRRPMGKEKETQAFDARQKGETDPKGQLRIAGFSRGGTFSRVPAKEVQGAFRQAVQEAPEAIERQRVTPEQAEMLKGYFQNLGGQKNR